MTCPECNGYVEVRADGTLFDHQRYADAAMDIRTAISAALLGEQP